MTMIAEHAHKAVRASTTSLDMLMAWISSAAARRRAHRHARVAARRLAEHTDAELADIGLTRADLTPTGVDDATERQAQAMLRVYR